MFALAGSALADGYSGSIKDAPIAPVRTFSYSVNAAVTTDYMFRGISQSSNNPAVSAGFDATYGIFYAGFWGSNVDFDGVPDASVEMDIYAGIKPVLGPVTFDLAVLGYLYPGAQDDLATDGIDESDYLELKAGASITPFTNASLAGNIFYSPDTFSQLGDVWTFEATAGYTFNAIGRFTPSISGTVGTVIGDEDEGYSVGTDDEYVYWNAGVGVAFDKFTLDVRYWDTDIENTAAGIGYENYADERVVGTIKVLLP